MRPEEIVLVTGATGALGPSLLEALAASGHHVVVLTRGGRSYSGAVVETICGDIVTGDTLGIDPGDADRLWSSISTVVHAAALTRFDAPPDAARLVNVEGTRHLLAFALRCPRLQRFCALSTVYVAGRRAGLVLEEELEHSCGFVNAYEASKYETEMLLRAWMNRLPICVCRLSTLLGHSTSGRVSKPAAIHHAITCMYRSLVPMIPGDASSPVDLLSEDHAVAAIAHLAGTGFRAGRTFHVGAGADALPLGELIDITMQAFIDHRPTWRKRAIEKPVLTDLATFELFRRSVEMVADSALGASVRALGHFAPQLAFPKIFDDSQWLASLQSAGPGLARPPIRDYLKAVVRHLLERNAPAESVIEAAS